jgi:hypothetical protein
MMLKIFNLRASRSGRIRYVAAAAASAPEMAG